MAAMRKKMNAISDFSKPLILPYRYLKQEVEAAF